MTALQTPPVSTTRARRPDGAPIIVAIVVAALAVTALWWSGTSADVGSTPGTALIAVSELAGLLAGLGVPVLLLLVGRVPWFERAVGLDRLVAWHRSLGTTVVLLVATHLLTMLVGGMLADRRTLWSEIGVLLSSIPDMLITVLGTALFFTAGIMSARTLRRKVGYETWFAIHVTLYLGIYLAFWHQIAAGVHLVGQPVARTAWTLLYVGTGASLLWYRLLRPIVMNARHHLRIHEVVVEAHGTTSIWLEGRHLHELGTQPGQFFLVRFAAPGHLFTAHPYSVSNVPTDEHIRFTVGALGDHSSAVATLRRGTRAFLEGPFGTFTADLSQSPRALLIAGGAGIGPIRSLSQDLVAKGRHVVVLHRVRSHGHLALAREFPTSSAITYIPLPGRRADLGGDPLSARSLARLVPDVATRDVFVCGPPAMTQTVVESVTTLGVPRDAVHFEELSLS